MTEQAWPDNWQSCPRCGSAKTSHSSNRDSAYAVPLGGVVGLGCGTILLFLIPLVGVALLYIGGAALLVGIPVALLTRFVTKERRYYQCKECHHRWQVEAST